MQNPANAHYIGLMSGTSCDGIDAVLLDTGPATARIAYHHYHAYSDAQRQLLLDLCEPGPEEIARMGLADRQLGEAFAQAALTLLREAGMERKSVRAIGSHGQTIRHAPPNDQQPGYTVQIGDPNMIAERTGIVTVADFRRRDMAAGGQGAPLASAFHRHAFGDGESDRAVLNLGGIANLTLLPRSGPVIGYDTGPANVLLDYWTHAEHDGARYDGGGVWSAGGTVIDSLLQQLLSHPYFTLKPPKSTGRETFNSAWLKQLLEAWRAAHPNAPEPKPRDVQSTLAELTAASVIQGLVTVAPQTQELLVCGGGSSNADVLHRMGARWSGTVKTTDAYGIGPTHVEAAAFAWLAHQRLQGQAGNIASVTGASDDRVLGGVWQA